MATAAIPAFSSHIAPVSSAEKKETKALSRYVELPADKLIRREQGKLCLSPSLKQHLWKIAAIATLVILSAFSLGILAVTFMTNPQSLLISMFLTSLSIPAIYNLYVRINGNSLQNKEAARIEAGVRAEHVKIKGKENEIAAPYRIDIDKVAAKGEQLTTLLAHLKFWANETDKSFKEFADQMATIEKLKAERKSSLSLEQVDEHGQKIEQLTYKIAQNGLKAGYFRALIDNPLCTKELHEIARVATIPAATRTWAGYCREEQIENLAVSFSDNTHMTSHELQSLIGQSPNNSAGLAHLLVSKGLK
jgi:hypothetical protein